MNRSETGWDLVADVRERVMRHGWAVQAVGSECGVPGCRGHDDQDDEEEADFGYTVGLSRYDGHPELIVTGIPQLETVVPLNELGQRVADGDWLHAGERLRLRWFPHAVQLVQVSPECSEDYLVFANELYRNPGSPPVAALQLVWPDAAGRFPWECGYALPAQWQPVLGATPTS